MPVKPQYENLYLKYQFDDDEKKEIAEKLAIKTQALGEIEDAKKSAASQFKSQAESVQNEITAAARMYKDGYEMRNIECEKILDFENGVVRHFRTDNGELASERKMTQAERQMEITDIEDPLANAEQLALADAHSGEVGRFMSQEKSGL